MSKTKLVATFRLLLVFLLAVGCASAPKEEMSSSANSRVEIERLLVDLEMAQKVNLDVFARKDYQKTVKYLEKAKNDLENGREHEKVIDDLRFARQALKKGFKNSGNRNQQLPEVSLARQRTVKAGVFKFPKLTLEMDKIDQQLSDQSHELDRLSPQIVEKYLLAYGELEKKVIVEMQLGNAKAQVNAARAWVAEKKAPKALRAAEMSVRNAEISISSNIRNQLGFQSAVQQANHQVGYLVEVMDTIKSHGDELSEFAASKLVLQKIQIASLQEEVSSSDDALREAEDEITEQSQEVYQGKADLKVSELALDRAQVSVNLQKALEASRTHFTDEEAEAYQQGGSLLIRLKAMNFESGRSKVPSESTALLTKILEVAKGLNAKQIRVEGHTDSIGNSALNQKLSEQRASSVARYLRDYGVKGTEVLSAGKGFEKPIASNKSEAGRAQNRRVDILITPTKL